MKNNKKKIIKRVCITSTIVVLSITTIKISCELVKLIQWENRQEERINEFERLRQYFEEHHDYYLQKIPEGMSIAPHKTSAKELTYPTYILSQGENIIHEYMPCFIFSSQKEAIKIINKLNSEEAKKYKLVSQSIFYIHSENDTKQDMLEEAQKYFEENEK